MIAFLIVLGVALYVFLGGVFGSILIHVAKWDEDLPGPYVCGALWPIMIPTFGGAAVGAWLGSSDRRRRDKASLERQRHDNRMAEIRAQEKSFNAARAYLKSEGVNVDVS